MERLRAVAGFGVVEPVAVVAALAAAAATLPRRVSFTAGEGSRDAPPRPGPREEDGPGPEWWLGPGPAVAESEAWEADGEGGRKSDGGSRALDFTLASCDMATLFEEMFS